MSSAVTTAVAVALPVLGLANLAVIILAMTKISDFAAKQNARNDQIDAAVAGLSADVKALNETIAKIQTSPGEITTDDQASLDALEARSQAVADKLAALDALTPVAVPAA